MCPECKSIHYANQDHKKISAGRPLLCPESIQNMEVSETVVIPWAENTKYVIRSIIAYGKRTGKEFIGFNNPGGDVEMGCHVYRRK
jgi:hypothetical protein